jgi:putative DNA primase/helicase
MGGDPVTQQAKAAFRHGLEDGAKLNPLPKSPKPSSDGRSDLSDNALATHFVSLHKGQYRFVHEWGQWLIWNGVYWQRDKLGRAFNAIRLSNLRCGVKSVQKTRAVETFAKSHPEISAPAEIWDSDPYLLRTPGGTVDLRTGELREASAGDCITMITAVAPAATADQTTCPRRLQFMDEINDNDKERIRFEQQWSGYSLTGDVSEQCLLFIYGPGGNGKGVRCQTTIWLLNDYAHVAAVDLFLVTYGTKHSTSQAALRGKRLVFGTETQEGRVWDINLIKQLTGGDPITARFMRCDDFTFNPELKLVVSSNNQPRLPSVGEAERRRFNLKKYDYKPPRRDKHLPDKLKQEGPGILRWKIDGCLDWQKNGLIRPESVVRDTEEYLTQQDDFANWLDDCAELRPGSTVGEPTWKLFASWKQWAEARNVRAGREAELLNKLQMPPYNCRYSRRIETKAFGETAYARGVEGIKLLVAASMADTEPGPF